MMAYQGGDVTAFATLVSRHERPLWTFIRRFVRDSATAEDLLQEVFVRVVKAASEWRAEAKVTTWLYSIAHNLCVDQARRSVHRRADSLDATVAGNGDSESSGLRLGEKVASLSRGAERQVLDREIRQRIDAAIATLPEDQRAVFLMREVMELSFAEIAAAVGASEPTVKSRMRYALEKLREALAKLRDTPVPQWRDRPEGEGEGVV